MGKLDFHIDFSIEVPDVEEALLTEAEQRLHALTENRNDLIGASIGLEDIAGVQDAFLYQARIVVYKKPKNIAVVEKRETPETALNDALDTIERRVRTARGKRRKVWQNPEQRANLSVFELTPLEIYNTYVDTTVSQETITEGRDNIAAKLMVEDKLDQKSAYHAADRILEHAYQTGQE
jgi:hypothetical protein